MNEPPKRVNGDARVTPPPPRRKAELDAHKKDESDQFIGKTIQSPQGNRYRILEKLGEGGMGSVYKAETEGTTELVAIKLVMGDSKESTEILRERTRREAEALYHTRHKHVVELVDYNLHGDNPFIVMEYLPGKSLKEHLGANGIPWESTAGRVGAKLVLLQTLEGLKATHGKEIIHRDIKPGNIMILPSGKVKLIDFGLIKQKMLEGDIHKTFTQKGFAMGTLTHIAPEQIGGKAETRSDIYAMGVVMFQLLTGQLPFDPPQEPFGEKDDTEARQVKINNRALALLDCHRLAPRPKPSETRPDLNIPEVLDAIVLKAMAKDPNERFQTAGEMAAAIRACNFESSTRKGISTRDAEFRKRTRKGSRIKAAVASVLIAGGLAAIAYGTNRYADRILAIFGHHPASAVADVGRPEADDAGQKEVADAGVTEAEAQEIVEAKAAYQARIDSDPSGAAVIRIVDGTETNVGQTPLSIDLEGEETFTIRKQGYKEQQVTLSPEASESSTRLERERPSHASRRQRRSE